MSIPPYQPPSQSGEHAAQQGTLSCPKCQGAMRTYERNGIHLEQCDACRGIFLDFGELESLTQLESRFVQQAPPPMQQPGGYGYGAGWGKHGGQHGGQQYRRGGFGRLFFSS